MQTPASVIGIVRHENRERALVINGIQPDPRLGGLGFFGRVDLDGETHKVTAIIAAEGLADLPGSLSKARWAVVTVDPASEGFTAIVQAVVNNFPAMVESPNGSIHNFRLKRISGADLERHEVLADMNRNGVVCPVKATIIDAQLGVVGRDEAVADALINASWEINQPERITVDSYYHTGWRMLPAIWYTGEGFTLLRLDYNVKKDVHPAHLKLEDLPFPDGSEFHAVEYDTKLTGADYLYSTPQAAAAAYYLSNEFKMLAARAAAEARHLKEANAKAREAIEEKLQAYRITLSEPYEDSFHAETAAEQRWQEAQYLLKQAWLYAFSNTPGMSKRTDDAVLEVREREVVTILNNDMAVNFCRVAMPALVVTSVDTKKVASAVKNELIPVPPGVSLQTVYTPAIYADRLAAYDDNGLPFANLPTVEDEPTPERDAELQDLLKRFSSKPE